MPKEYINKSKDLLNRNKVIFVLGIFLVIVFIFLIFLDRTTENEILPELRKITSQEATTTGSVLNPAEKEVQKELEKRLEESYQKQENAAELEKEYLQAIEKEKILEANAESSLNKTKLSQEQVDARFGVMEVKYTEQGFSPSYAKAFSNQRFAFVNNTNKRIEIAQKMPRFEQYLNNNIVLEPGGRIEFRADIEGYWTFEEKTSNHFGRAFFKEATQGSEFDYLNQY